MTRNGNLWLIGSVFLLGLFSFQAVAQPPGLDKKEMQEAEILLKEIFAEEYQKAKEDRLERQKLARTLLSQSKDILDEEEVRYVVLSQVKDLAARAADIETAFQAIAELKKHFRLKTLPLAADVLHLSLQNTTDAGKMKQITELSFQLVTKAQNEDEFAVAVRFGKIAEEAAKRSGQEALLKSIQARNAELIPLVKEAERIQPFLDKLKIDPKDARANEEVGKYWCFQHQRWSRGLPYLAKSDHPVLAQLAQKDLQNPQKGSEKKQLAEAWWKAAEDYKDPIRLRLLRRAFQWYGQALLQLSGAEKEQAQKRYQTLAQLLPSALREADIEVEIRQFKGHTGEVLNAAFASDGLHCASCGADKTLRLWDVHSGKLMQTISGHIGIVYDVAYSPNGKSLFSASEDRTVRMWEVDSGKEVRKFTGNTDFVNGVAVSPDGTLVAGAGQDRVVRVWDVKSGKEVKQLVGHLAGVFRVVFSPDGKHLATCSEDQTIRLWDVKTGQQKQIFQGHIGAVLGVAFSPDGKQLLSGGEDLTIRLWDLASGKELRRYLGHQATVGSVAFSPEGTRFLSASDDRTLRLWDVKTGRELHKLTGHSQAVYRIVYSPDGRWALSASLDGSVRLWGERQ